MAKATSRFTCQSCGAVQAKWTGRCESCGSWNSLVEETPQTGPAHSLARKPGKATPVQWAPLDGESSETPRRTTGIAELDRVVGGGFVPGSALLLGGDPGIGKSTLLLQVTAKLSRSLSCLYVSGEEAVEQVRLRARRLDLADNPVQLAAATDIRDIVAALDGVADPALLIVDSVQTLFLDTLDSAPGTVAQVRASAQELIRVAKARDLVLVLVGHVTKEGTIAGPRVLEHMVDTVLAFDGERGHQFRLLRATKNRFGPADEIGVFEMTEQGLAEVANPSALFLADRRDDVAGAAVFAGLEGTRPVLLEVQALVASSSLATPRRAVVGWDQGRLAMLIAVLDARCGVALGGQDVYLNIAGGLRISEPAADLAVAAALVSALTGTALPEGTVLLGEVGLSGEIRPVSQMEMRLKEAAKLGFTQAWTPPLRGSGSGRKLQAPSGLAVTPFDHLSEVAARLAAASAPNGADR